MGGVLRAYATIEEPPPGASPALRFGEAPPSPPRRGGRDGARGTASNHAEPPAIMLKCVNAVAASGEREQARGTARSANQLKHIAPAAAELRGRTCGAMMGNARRPVCVLHGDVNVAYDCARSVKLFVQVERLGFVIAAAGRSPRNAPTFGGSS